MRGHRDKFASREEYSCVSTRRWRLNRMRVSGGYGLLRKYHDAADLAPSAVWKRLGAAAGEGEPGEYDPCSQQRLLSAGARLIGEWVEAWVGADQIEVRYAQQEMKVLLPRRLRGQEKHQASTTATLLAGWCGSLERSRSIAIRRICSRAAGFGRRTTCFLAAKRQRASKEYLRLLHLAGAYQ